MIFDYSKRTIDRDATKSLKTVHDLVRYGVSIFHHADLVYGHGTGNAYDEAAFITLESLNLPIDGLDLYKDCQLSMTERRAVIDIFRRRVETRKPATYLLNRAYIQGLPFYVDERVIVPRSFIAEILCRNDSNNPVREMHDVTSVLDLCTGSGCLAVLAGYLYPNAHIDAVDLSRDALDVAQRNIAEHDMDHRITLHHGDLFAPWAGNRYDLILTNPPYVDGPAMGELPPEYSHEPRMALDGGTDGMDLVRKIIAAAPAHLNQGGGMMCEIGMGRPVIDSDYADQGLVWLDTELSQGEVFWMRKRA